MVTVLAPRAILRRLERLGETGAIGTGDVFTVVGIIFGYMLTMVHALALTGFAGFHTHLVLSNRTTIESNEPRQVLHADALKRMDTARGNHWRAVMGSRALLWFIPVTQSCQGDGIHWRRMDDVL